jgi:hypothetical protein
MAWVASNADQNDSFRSALGDSWQLQINFADFDIGLPKDPWNREAAKQISNLLMSQVNLDDLASGAWELECDIAVEYPCFSMCGGGMRQSAPSISHVYAAMASVFSSYSVSSSHTIWLGKLDYRHLQTLYKSLIDDTLVDSPDLQTLKITINQFATHYSDHDKKFLLELF